MEKIFKYFLAGLVLITVNLSNPEIYSKSFYKYSTSASFDSQQVALDGNNIKSYIANTGIFNRNIYQGLTPGFEWPKGSGSYAVSSSGLTIAANVNNQLLMSCGFYSGEYAPGHVINSGVPIAVTDTNFHLYKVKRGDNANNNPDWLHWGSMVPYGAPYIDVNNNGSYEPNVDTPGVKNAEQTIFLCMTDGFSAQHGPGIFGGGTAPLFNEVHLTAWCYNTSYLKDVQFFKWVIINKNTIARNNTYISVVNDPDLGCAYDDFIGSDSARNLGYCYNGEPMDDFCDYRYPDVPPAVGFQWIYVEGITKLQLKSIVHFHNIYTLSAACEKEPQGDPAGAYGYMKGLKRDLTPWVVPPGGNVSYVTKYLYSGDPETGTGWCEETGNPSGSIWNCGGPTSYSGDLHTPNPYADRRIILSAGSDNLTMSPGDTQNVIYAQLIAQGTSYLNSVTKLKQLADSVKVFCNREFPIGIKQISNEVPLEFSLSQNYPNPFNPTTKIKFSIPNTSQGGATNISLNIYDVLGRIVAALIPPLRGGQEGLLPGTYEVEWNASGYSSGVYYYSLQTGSFLQTRKMILIK